MRVPTLVALSVASRQTLLRSPLYGRGLGRLYFSAVPEEPTIDSRLASVRELLEQAAHASSRPAPRLVAVSKMKPAEAVRDAYEAGHRDFGENYIQELLAKAEPGVLPADVRWRFIGLLQSNKVKKLVEGVPNLVAVETVGSEKLARKLDGACEGAKRETPLDVFIQVDTSGEETKGGVTPGAEAVALGRHIAEGCPRLRLAGLMTIGAPGDAGCFDTLAACRDEIAGALGLEAAALELSMGMSGDFEAAIERGSTSVRVGTSIFGARDYSKK